MKSMLSKGLDLAQRPPCRRQLPIKEELVLVLGGPLDRQAQGAGRKSPIEYFKALYRDLDLEFPVYGVEMRWSVIIEMHPDDDSVEAR